MGEALQRIAHDPKLIRAFERALGWVPHAAEIWIWGDRGIGIVSVHDCPYDETYAYVEYLQSEPGVSLRRLSTEVLEPWVRARGLRVIVGAVSRFGKAWTRLTGYRPEYQVVVKRMR